MRKDDENAPDLLERFMGRWPEFMHRPMLFWPAAMSSMLQVEEFRADGDLVIRAEIPGIDPERDVEITIDDDDVLHIAAERRQEENAEDKDYYRREFRYGSFRRNLQLPRGVNESDIKATYRSGVLEIRVTVPKEAEQKPTTKKIPVSM